MLKLGNPYREMATTCMTRPIAEKMIVWKRFESEPFEEGRFQAKVLSRRFIDSAASVFRKAYPEVVHQGRLASSRDFPRELCTLEETGSGISGMHHPLLPLCP
jgi:hypothetical protein